jgi:mycofactocin precursor peptide peptidase
MLNVPGDCPHECHGDCDGPAITFTTVNRSVRLSELTWTELALRQRPPVIVIPVGATEQHGPHLPLGTDTIIAQALSARLCEALLAEMPAPHPEAPMLIGPTLQISASGEHDGFPGTLSLGTEVTTRAIVEIARSTDWSAGLLLVNGHGGNYQAVTAAKELLDGEERALRAWWPRIPGGDLHAGLSETSLMLHLRPDLVQVTHAVPGPSPDLAALQLHGVKALSPSGVLGDPSAATAEQGRVIFDALSEDLRLSAESWFADALRL